MRGWRVVGFSYADKGELQPKGTRALRGWAGSGAGGQCCLRAETRGTGTSVSCPSSPRASPGADVPPRPLSRQEAACFRLMARDEFTFEEARIWTNMGQVLSGAGSAASAQNSGVVFFTGSLQGYLYFSEQHDATQTGQEPSPSHADFKGRKTSSWAAGPCSAGGPWAHRRCGVWAGVPPWAGYLPHAVAMGPSEAAHTPPPPPPLAIITPVTGASPFLLGWVSLSGSRNTWTLTGCPGESSCGALIQPG